MFRVLLLVLVAGLIPAFGAVEREYILLSGGPSLIEWEKFKAEPHDRWWGNFIRAARVRIQQLRAEHGPNARITWLVHRPSYVRRASRQDNDDLIGNIVSVRDKFGVNLVWFNNGSEVIDYLNNGQPRNRVKIANFEFYGHSNRACFMFDYSNEIDSASKSWLHEDELFRIKRGIFTRDAFVKSWGCHTGESMSKYWRRATGTRMIGAIGKTNYAYGHLRGWVPALSDGARWGG
ncbi:MAG: hypothetical protein SFU53_13885 [Terrimicrobiaceae bacterium]|nr:hypothetical protein [Terrimicrobiaceae bacterium]